MNTDNLQNVDALNVLFNCVWVLFKINYSLNFQDIPEFFEDNMSIFMLIFLKWKAKDTAIYLLISITAKSATSNLGAIRTNQNINIKTVRSKLHEPPNLFGLHISKPSNEKSCILFNIFPESDLP